MDNAHDFTVRLRALLRGERVALADFLVALADFDARRLWVDLGHSSLFYFLHRDLGLSKGAAFYRKTAAELIQRFPSVVEPLRDGRLCLTSVVELAKVLTDENLDEVLPRFFQLSKREAKEVSAELRPVEVPPRREVVTPVRAAAGSAAALALQEVPSTDLGQPVHPANQVDAAQLLVHPANQRASDPVHAPESASRSPVPAAPSASATIEPLTADLSRLHVTVSRRFLEKLEAARDALSHSHPGAGADEILEAGLDLLLERAAKRKGLVENPRREPPPTTDRGHVPAHVRRVVWERDGGRCQYPLASGGVCGSTLRLELDHVLPRAQGGPSTIDNLRVCCRFHNGLAAREAYGDAWMERYTRGRRARQRAEPRPASPHSP
jgi:HNH endonuclease